LAGLKEGKMPSESEVREALEILRNPNSSERPIAFQTLKSLAEAWLARKWTEKLTYVPPNYPPDCPQGFILGWNEHLNACRLASVVSEEEIEKILDGFQSLELATHDGTKKIAHAIAEYCNRGIKNG
jgi:hypothetical protein